MSLNFDSRGRIELEKIGRTGTLDRWAHEVGQNARLAKRDVSQLVHWLILRTEIQAIAAVLLIFAAAYLMFTCISFFQAYSQTPVVSQQLLLPRQEFIDRSERAIRSSQLADKLDVLILQHFQGIPQREAQLLQLRRAVVLAGIFVLTLLALMYFSYGKLDTFIQLL